MKKLLLALLLSWCSFTTPAAELYPHFVQPPGTNGGLVGSSWWEPDGSDWDDYVWDSFVLPTAQSVTEITWRGGHAPLGQGGPVVDFAVRIYASRGEQPDFVAGPLVNYSTGNNAGETPAGTVGGVAMQDYRFALPVAFEAAAGVRYWVEITAAQHGIPDWGLTVGTRGNGLHTHLIPGTHTYVSATNDLAFALLTPDPVNTITTSNSPAGGGATSGGGSYTNGSNVTVVATANAGYGFVDWREGVTQVSTTSNYTFVADSDRTLVARFVALYTITTSAAPAEGGTTSGGGIYPSGSNVTVRAVANPGYRFVNWTQNGVQVYTLTNYLFTVSANRTLVANFVALRTITTSASPVEGGTTSGGGIVTNGASVTVHATVANGYAFLGWTEGGVSVSTAADFTFTATADRALVANFVALRTITTSASPVEGGTTSGGGTVTNGASVTVHATVASGYMFLGWTEGGVSVSTAADYSFTANADRALVANFELANRPPVAGNDIIERNSDGLTKVLVATLLGNDTDPDSDPIQFLSVSGTSTNGGTIARNGDWVFYTPPAGVTNADAFTYTITDGQNPPATGTVVVQVNSSTAPSANLVLAILGNGSYLLRFDGIPGKTYRIEYTDSLTPAVWQPLGSGTADAFGVFQFTDTPPSGLPHEAYRSIHP